MKPEIPFIFVSGTIGEETAIDSLQNGATDYVLKHRLSRLIPAMRRALAEAMAHLGHGSKAIHYAYSEKAEIVTLPLDYYEEIRQKKIIEFTRTAAA